MAVVEACLRKTSPVCEKNGPVCPNSVLLVPEKSLTFGRIISAETNVRLLSKKAPLMISRKHATLSYMEGKWCINDHESLNGVFVNGQKIPSGKPWPLNTGDKVAFGVPLPDNSSPEFEYTFELMTKNKGKKRPADNDLPPTGEGVVKHRKVLSESDRNIKKPGCSSSKQVSVVTCHLSEEKVKAAEERIEKLRVALEDKEKSFASVVEQLQETEKDMNSKLLEQKVTLEQDKAELEMSLKNLLAEKLHEKDQLLREQLIKQNDLLIAEKERVELALQAELSRKLEEKDKELESKLTRQKEDLINVIAEKEMEQVHLQLELEEYRIAGERLQGLEENERKLASTVEELQHMVQQKEQELRRQLEVTKKAEEDARKTVVEQMEDEFTCIVCQELFVFATTLACSHSFCEHCLFSWMAKKSNCPMCRQRVKGEPVRSIVLDNAIGRMVESMDEEARKRRQELIQEREQLKRAAAYNKATQGTEANPIYLGDHEHGHNQSRGGRGGNGRPQVYYVDEPGPAHADRRFVDGRNQQHLDYRNQQHQDSRAQQHHYHGDQHYGRPPHYNVEQHGHNYGEAMHSRPHYGHGHCFICGMRGHLARQCPFRR